jgi:hypothetical protein
LIVLATVTSAAQDKPDFSGRWILDPPRESGPDVASALTVRQASVRTTGDGDRTEPFRNIAVDRQFGSITRSETYLIGVLGGFVPGINADGSPNGPKGHLGITWEGHSLVFESGSYTGPDPETGLWDERREVWSLDPDGRLRVVITTRSSADGSKAITWVYRRP